MKKLLSILIVPIMALTMFMGCSKVKHNANTVSQLYINFMDKYISQGKNLMFKNNIYPNDNENNEGDYTEEDGIYYPTYEKVMYIGYNHEQLQNAVTNFNLESSTPSIVQAGQLTTVYQGLLSLIFNYYANWSSNFYTVAKETEISEKEWTNLYEKLYSLTKTAETFVEKRLELERDIRMNDNKLDSQLVSQKLNAFNATFNDLILDSLKFVNEFKYMHKKYVFNNNDITPSSAKRLVDEALLLIAEGIFYDNVLAFEKNNTVDLYQLNQKEDDFIWFNKVPYYTLFIKHNNALVANSNIDANIGDTDATVAEMLVVIDNNNELKQQAIERVKQLKTYVHAYEQNLQNYKSIFNKTNLDNYNYARNLIAKPSSFNFNNLSVEEQSNINFLKSFSYNKTATLFSALSQVSNVFSLR